VNSSSSLALNTNTNNESSSAGEQQQQSSSLNNITTNGQNKRNDSQFNCLQMSGLLKSGRSYPITFEFEPTEIGIQETFWRFRIPKYNLTVPFLLVGNVSEPKVNFDKSHVSFKPLLISNTGQEIIGIINQENVPVSYAFDQTTCYTEGRSAVVIVEPSSGVIEPNGRANILLSFTPHEQKTSIFNIKCQIASASRPIYLNVKGDGFSMLTNLACEDSNTGETVNFSDSAINEVHLGEVEKNESSFRNFYITNKGKYPVQYYWKFEIYNNNNDESLKCFSIEPDEGEIEAGDKKRCVLKYSAKYEHPTMANLLLKIQNGSTYHVHLDGIAVHPDLKLSTNCLDFSSCFIYRAGMSIKQKQITLTNNSNKDINVSCLYDQQQQSNGCFQFDFKQTILKPGKSITGNCTFLPKQAVKYEDKIVFELNGLTRRELKLIGAGVEMRIELVDSKNKKMNMGTLQIDKKSKKNLQLINRSGCTVDVVVFLEPRNDILQMNKEILQITYQKQQQINKNMNQSIVSNNKNKITLKPNQIFDIELKFSPNQRIPRFSEELTVECDGIYIPLCTVEGACQGYNIWLDQTTLPFGAISQRCSITKRVVLHNDGDIGASFNWEIEKMKPEFSIQPVLGYISPGMDVNFDITFTTTELALDVRKTGVKCFIEGVKKPILLTLTGSCIQIVAQRDVQYFETSVRTQETKQITITNRSFSQWNIKPVSIEGDYFSGLESFIIEPQASVTYDVNYYPLSMTTSGQDSKKHTGSIFFPLPDGTGLLYNLVGTANPPKAISKIQREVPCKTSFVEILNIDNWLKKAQRFKVSFEYSSNRVDSSTTLKGHDYIDVPGNGRKDYRVNYYAHKEGMTVTRVVFRNEQTNEYCFYELSFKAVKGASLASIDLTTQVRVPITYSLKIDNPLSNLVTFTSSCSNNEILLPSSLSISSKTQVNHQLYYQQPFNSLISSFFFFFPKSEFSFEFLPLKPSETVSKLELSSNELGVCSYDLVLKALPPSNERPVHFKTSLGSSQVVVVKFINYCRQKADYTCKVIKN
jgi:hydrocephalus-inducing protein